MEWRIAINISKSTAIIFVLACRRVMLLRPVTLFAEPIECVVPEGYLKVTQDKQIICSPLIDRLGKKHLLGPILNRKSNLYVRIRGMLYKHLIHPILDYACLALNSTASTHVRRLRLLQSNAFSFLLMPYNIRLQGDTRGFCAPSFCYPHQTPDFVAWFDVRWSGEPSSTTTRQIITLNLGWHRHLTRNSSAAGASRTVEENAHYFQLDKTNRVRRRCRREPPVCPDLVLRDFAQLYGKR
jgi:hypothetical protein